MYRKTMGFGVALTLLTVIALSAGSAAKAQADDAGRLLAAIAVGALTYDLLDSNHYGGRCNYRCGYHRPPTYSYHRRPTYYQPPTYNYYRPPTYSYYRQPTYTYYRQPTYSHYSSPYSWRNVADYRHGYRTNHTGHYYRTDRRYRSDHRRAYITGDRRYTSHGRRR